MLFEGSGLRISDDFQLFKGKYNSTGLRGSVRGVKSSNKLPFSRFRVSNKKIAESLMAIFSVSGGIFRPSMIFRKSNTTRNGQELIEL